jgi:long-chain fatty acid transport protein
MKRFTLSMGTIAVALLAVAPGRVEAAGFSNSAQSATSTAMGGVGAANPHEPNATFFNAALMSQHDGFNIYAGPSFILPSTSYESQGGERYTTEPSLFPPPNGHVSYGVSDELSVGVGATFPYGLGIAWEDDWPGRENIQSQQLQTLDVNPSVSYQISDMGLTVAAGGQIVFSSIELRRKIILRDDTEIQSHLGGTGRGYGGTAGLLFQPNDSLTFGVNYRSAVKVNYEGRAHFENEEGTPFEDQFVDGDVRTSITLPHTVTIGAGWQLKRLFLELDLEYRTWTTYDEVVLDFEKDRPSDTTTITNNWNDTGAVRFGAQYEVVDDLALRFGGAYDMSPIPDATVNASLPGNDRSVATFGGGYTLSNGLRFDAAYKLVSTLPRDIENDRAPNGTYQTTAHVFSVNVGYGY